MTEEKLRKLIEGRTLKAGGLTTGRPLLRGAKPRDAENKNACPFDSDVFVYWSG